MVHVTDGAHVDVRLGAFELAFCHLRISEERALPVGWF
jgi:hypothetical protein